MKRGLNCSPDEIYRPWHSQWHLPSTKSAFSGDLRAPGSPTDFPLELEHEHLASEMILLRHFQEEKKQGLLHNCLSFQSNVQIHVCVLVYVRIHVGLVFCGCRNRKVLISCSQPSGWAKKESKLGQQLLRYVCNPFSGESSIPQLVWMKKSRRS